AAVGIPSVVVVNDALASRYHVTNGSTLDLAASPTDPPVAFRVVGTFASPFTGTGVLGRTQIALLKLSALQRLVGLDATDAGTRIALRLDDATREDPA